MKLAYSMSTGFVDFPGKYAATIYLTGCNLRCPYCYNMQVVNGEPTLEYDDILEYLFRMKKIFPKFYVVISGGEPTLPPSLRRQPFSSAGRAPSSASSLLRPRQAAVPGFRPARLRGAWPSPLRGWTGPGG